MEAAAVAFAAAALGIGALIAFRAWRRRRVTPDERERRRRANLVLHGKLTDATLVEIGQDVLFYSYIVRGVEYTASQDVSALRSLVPTGLGLAASVKFDARIPANSIVLAEQWSGLHAARAG
jgi:hypothetical protein